MIYSLHLIYKMSYFLNDRTLLADFDYEYFKKRTDFGYVVVDCPNVHAMVDDCVIFYNSQNDRSRTNGPCVITSKNYTEYFYAARRGKEQIKDYLVQEIAKLK